MSRLYTPAVAILAALLIAPIASAGRPGVRSDPQPQVMRVQQVPIVQTVQTVQIECPQTYYENETRTRMVQQTRMVPITEEVEQQYQVQVAKTRMVPRTVQIPCVDCPPDVGVRTVQTPVGCPGCHCPGCPDGLGVDVRGYDGQTEEPAGCLQRLRARRMIRMGRAG
jgi:hypothetical protein